MPTMPTQSEHFYWTGDIHRNSKMCLCFAPAVFWRNLFKSTMFNQ